MRTGRTYGAIMVFLALSYRQVAPTALKKGEKQIDGVVVRLVVMSKCDSAVGATCL